MAMQNDIDPKDRLIIGALQRNARMSIKSLAATTGLARSTVRDRLSRLEETGVITGYRVETALPDGQHVKAFLLVKLEKTPAHDVVARVENFDDVTKCHSVSGDTDLIVEMSSDTIASLNDTRDSIASLPAVLSVNTSIVLRTDIDRNASNGG